MTIEESRRACGLVADIKFIERLVVVYRDADQIVIGTLDGADIDESGRIYFDNKTMLPATEFRDKIIAGLKARIAAKEAELQALGVE
jgi:hypothetical protein